VETFEYFSVHSAGSEGVMVLVQHYRDIPLMRKESFVLSPGFEVSKQSEKMSFPGWRSRNSPSSGRRGVEHHGNHDY